jgi:hypothetical protein
VTRAGRPGRHRLGAFLRAIGELQADAETAARIAALFDIDLAPHGEVEGDPTPAKESVPPAVDDDGAVDDGFNPGSDAPRAPSGPARQGDEQATPGALRPLRVAKRSGPTVASAPKELGTLPIREAGPRLRVLPLEPLLRPVVTRSVVASALAQRAPTGAVDLDRLVDIVARRQPVATLPRLPRWHIASMTRVLIDRSPGMAPFGRDANDLAERIRAVASRDRSEAVGFWQSPRRCGSSPTSARRLPPPPRGATVIALTHLGIGGSSAPTDLVDDWLTLADDLAGGGCALVVFVPYPASRWPATLAGRLRIVHWDRGTTVADVRAVLRERGSRSAVP